MNPNTSNRGIQLLGYSLGPVLVAEAAVNMRTLVRIGSQLFPDFSLTAILAISHPGDNGTSVRKTPDLQILRIFSLPAGHRKFELFDPMTRIATTLASPPPLAENIAPEDLESVHRVAERYGFVWEAPIISTSTYRSRTVEEFNQFTAISDAQFREQMRAERLARYEALELAHHERWLKAKADREAADERARDLARVQQAAAQALAVAEARTSSAREDHFSKLSHRQQKRVTQQRRIPSAKTTSRTLLCGMTVEQQAKVPDWYLAMMTGAPVARPVPQVAPPAPSMDELAPATSPKPVSRRRIESFASLADFVTVGAS